MTQVATIRDINNRYPELLHRHSLLCPEGHGRFTSDLARYWCSEDNQEMLCPHCDAVLWFRFENGDRSDPLAQRVTARIVRV